MPSHAPLRPARARLLLLALLTALLAGLLTAAPGSAPAARAESATPTATTSSPAAERARRVLAEAARHRGAPYRYGATGPSRFDCSGYVKYVFGRVGTALPRTSRAQYAASRHVAKTAKQPGDLVFTRTSSGRIVHVGIYAGSGRFWVAPKTGDVVKLQKIYTTNYVVGRV